MWWHEGNGCRGQKRSGWPRAGGCTMSGPSASLLTLPPPITFLSLRMKSPVRCSAEGDSLGLVTRRRSFTRSLAWLVFLMLTGCPASSQQDLTAEQPPAKPFQLIAAGDTQGWIMPCGCTSNQSGGLLRRASYVNQQRRVNEVVLVDVGGAADGIAPYQLAKFKAVLDGEQLMGIAAHNLGAAEIAFGASKIRELSRSKDFPFVSANVRDEQGQLLVDTHQLVDVAGQTLLLTGVVSPQYQASGLHIDEPADAILSVLDNANHSFDWLVILAYSPEEELRSLAATLPEATAIIGGPTGQSLSSQRVGHVLLTSATNKGKFLAELTFDHQQSEPVKARIVEMSPDYPDEAEQQANLDRFRDFLAQRDFTARESGLLDENRWSLNEDQRVAGTDACLECHQQTCDEWKETGHAHAWERLVSENAHVDSYCQQCHTTGFGWPDGFVSVSQEIERFNVGCESCHGPSLAHAEDSTVRTPFDAQGQCIKCHDVENSPTFAYDPYWELIEHE